MHLGNAAKSVWFFSKLLFARQKYDVVFIYRNTFVRDGSSIPLLEPFIEGCQKNGLRYLLLESRHRQRHSGHRYLSSDQAVSYNLISFLQGKLRKYFSKQGITYGTGKEWDRREEKVAKVLQRLFFRNLKAKLFVTLVGNNNMIFLKSIYPDSIFAEYQHGIFWCQNDPETIIRNSYLRKTRYKDTFLLLYGEGFAKIHSNCPGARMYAQKNIRIAGSYFPVPDYINKQNNKTILYTLQNIDMGSNAEYYQTIKALVEYNAAYLQENGYRILFKNHPRYERDDALVFKETYPFVSFVGDEEPLDMLGDISIHITSKSTTALDAALHSIPTIFVDMLDIRSPKEIFFEQYRYPLMDFRVEKPSDLKEILGKLENQEYYHQCSQNVYEWAREYYQDFDEQVFLGLISTGETSSNREVKYLARARMGKSQEALKGLL